ncbi:MAG: gliding motility protein GldM [Chitinophagaceae bacterium]|nr:gliding motility protein GldM [Chitinophagaceae bacterium]
MSLPKEPRQKMINMMYLVLTALLALNVSTEVINAFKTVNATINNANGVLTGNNSNIYTSFEEKAKDPKTAEKTAIWKPKADRAKELAAQLYSHIDSLKERVKREAGYNLAKGDTTDWTDNLDATTRVLDKEGEGEKLLAKLTQFKKDMLSIDPEIAKEFATKLPIDLSTPKSSTGSKNQTWTTSYFHMTPAIAGLTILSKFQNDVKSSENQIVTYCHNKIGEVAVRFDKYGFVGGLSSSYVMPNEKVQVYAGLGATSSAAAPTILINGRPVQAGADGIALSEFASGGTGSGKVHVTIKYKDQDGLDKTIEKDLPYTVGSPSGVAVSADKMNVLYIGVENPLTITAGVGSEKVSASFSGGTLTKVGGPKWIAKPTTQGEHNINVIIEGKSTPVKFRVKRLPDPFAYVGQKRGGSMPAADFKAMGGLIARLDSDFEAPFRVISYTVGALGGKYPTYQIANNQGNRWSGAAETLINGATPGTAIFFDNIKVVGPDGITRDLPQMSFNLK